MHEAFMSDSEDEGGEDHLDQHQYKYMATDDLKTIINENDDQHNYDTTDDGQTYGSNRKTFTENATAKYVNQNMSPTSAAYQIKSIDNVTIIKPPVHLGFLVSFLVDARGGSMRGCRHSGVRVIVPPKSCAQPTRITCRYVKPQRVPNPPPLMEGEALVSRVMELSPVEAKFLGSVILEVPHFGSLRDKEREIIILRSDNGETWREHTLYDSEEAVRDVLNETFESNELSHLEDLHTSRIVRIVTRNFPHFFAVVSRIRQEVHAIGPDGGTVSSTAVPQVQAIFPPNALTKKIRVGLQAQPVDLNGCCKLLGQGVAVSPVVTVEPRRRKFHKAITLSIPAPKAYTQGMVNQYSGNAPTLRLLCSITGGQNRAVWEDVTGSTPLAFVKDSVSFTTTVSARFWLMDCRNVSEASRMATELYSYMAQVPFMVKFVVFAKRISNTEAKLSVFCMTDDKEDKTLEQQEYFTEVAKSRDVEIPEDQDIYLEFAGNLLPVLKSGEQLNMKFHAFRENRLSFLVRVKDQEDPFGRISFMSEPKICKGEAPQTPLCTLNVTLTGHEIITDNHNGSQKSLDHSLNYRDMLNFGYRQADEIHKADIRLSDICNLLEDDWVSLAKELHVPENDIELIKSEYTGKQASKQAMVMLRLWLRQAGNNANGNTLEQALHKINRSDIVEKCIFNLELVTDYMEKAVAKMQLDQSGFDSLKDDLASASCDTSLVQPQQTQKFNNILDSDMAVVPLPASTESLQIEEKSVDVARKFEEKSDKDAECNEKHESYIANHIEDLESPVPKKVTQSKVITVISQQKQFDPHYQQQYQQSWVKPDENSSVHSSDDDHHFKSKKNDDLFSEQKDNDAEVEQNSDIDQIPYDGPDADLATNIHHRYQVPQVPADLDSVGQFSPVEVNMEISSSNLDDVVESDNAPSLSHDAEIISSTSEIVGSEDIINDSDDQLIEVLPQWPVLTSTSVTTVTKVQTQTSAALNDQLNFNEKPSNINDSYGAQEDVLKFVETQQLKNDTTHSSPGLEVIGAEIGALEAPIEATVEKFDKFSADIAAHASAVAVGVVTNITSSNTTAGASTGGNESPYNNPLTKSKTSSTKSLENNIKTVGSSSDSDIALHEPGIELSEDEEHTEPEFYQGIEQSVVEIVGNHDDDWRAIKTMSNVSAEDIQSQKEQLMEYLDNSILSSAARAAELQEQQHRESFPIPLHVETTLVEGEPFVEAPVISTKTTTIYATETDSVQKPHDKFEDGGPLSVVGQEMSLNNNKASKNEKHHDLPSIVIEPVKNVIEEFLNEEKTHFN